MKKSKSFTSKTAKGAKRSLCSRLTHELQNSLQHRSSVFVNAEKHKIFADEVNSPQERGTMKRASLLAFSIVFLVAATTGEKQPYPNRWLRLSSNLRDDREIER